MKPFILCIALILAVTFVRGTEIEDPAVASIDSSPFGKSLMDMIQLQFTTNLRDPVATITKALMNMRSSMVDDQSREDKLHMDELQDCIKFKKELRKEIRTAKANLAQAKTSRRQIALVLAALTKEVTDSQAIASTLKDAIARLDTQRQKEVQAYKKQLTNINRQREALIKARNILKNDKRVQGSSFLEQDGKACLAEVRTGLLQVELDDEYLNALHGMAVVYLETAEKTGRASGNVQILQIIDKLLEAIGDFEYGLGQDDRKSETEYQEIKKKKEELLRSEDTRLTTLRAKQQTNQGKKKQLTNDILIYTRSISQKRGEYKSRRTQCKDNHKTYYQRKHDRTEQLAIVDQVIDFINERLDNVEKYIRNRKTK